VNRSRQSDRWSLHGAEVVASCGDALGRVIGCLRAEIPTEQRPVDACRQINPGCGGRPAVLGGEVQSQVATFGLESLLECGGLGDAVG
jgi:hypothetical protein